MTIHSMPVPVQDADAQGQTVFTLADVLVTLEADKQLSPVRLRDLRSGVSRVSSLIGKDPASIPLDLPAIRAKLTAINPIGAGFSIKTFATIRSNFLAAIKASGLKQVQRSTSEPLTPVWTSLLKKLSDKRHQSVRTLSLLDPIA